MLYPNKIKIVIIYKNYFSNHDFFYKSKILQVFDKQKGAGRKFIISAPAPGGNLILAPRLWLRNTAFTWPVNSVAGLALHLWVPVHVQHEEMVGAHQVQSHSSSRQR